MARYTDLFRVTLARVTRIVGGTLARCYLSVSNHWQFMKAIKAPQFSDHTVLLLLGAVWGSSFLCVSIALKDYPPTSIAAIRIALAALILLAIIRVKGLSLPRSARDWIFLFVIGALNSSIPFSLISFAQQSISSGMSAMLISTAPFSALLIAHYYTHDDKISGNKVFGMLIGFGGVLVLVGADVLASRSDAVGGQLMALLAAFCYGSSSLLIRKVSHINSLVSSASVLLVTSLYFLPLVAYIDQPWLIEPSFESLMALVYLGIMPTALAYLLRFWLINRVGSVYVSQVAYVIPLFALAWGWLFLHEVPDTKIWLAMALILAGIAVNSWSGKKRKS